MLDHQPLRPLCEICKRLPARSNGVSALGFQRWAKYCNTCAKHKYIKQKKDTTCEDCGFECSDLCQMCYVDGRTLCLNCNALRLRDLKKTKTLTVDGTVGDWGNIRL